MQIVKIHAAKTHISRLIDAAARLVTPAAPTRRVLGRVAGRWSVPDDFDAPLTDDLLDAFEGAGGGGPGFTRQPST